MLPALIPYLSQHLLRLSGHWKTRGRIKPLWTWSLTLQEVSSLPLSAVEKTKVSPVLSLHVAYPDPCLKHSRRHVSLLQDNFSSYNVPLSAQKSLMAAWRKTHVMLLSSAAHFDPYCWQFNLIFFGFDAFGEESQFDPMTYLIFVLRRQLSWNPNRIGNFSNVKFILRTLTHSLRRHQWQRPCPLNHSSNHIQALAHSIPIRYHQCHTDSQNL